MLEQEKFSKCMPLSTKSSAAVILNRRRGRLASAIQRFVINSAIQQRSCASAPPAPQVHVSGFGAVNRETSAMLAG